MSQHTSTSASRLLAEVHRIKSTVNDTNAFHTWIPGLFGGDDYHWSRGVLAYTRLCATFVSDVSKLSGARSDRYRQAAEAAMQLADPARYPSAAKAFVGQVLGDLTIERLESADELLVQAGQARSIDEEHVRLVLVELDGLIAEIAGDVRSSIDEFLLQKLREISFILNRYDLFGSEGAEEAVAGLVGTINLNLFAGVKLSPKDEARIKTAFHIAKGVMDGFVYTYSATQALAWAGAATGLLPAAVVSLLPNG